jgi:hypothetical protein
MITIPVTVTGDHWLNVPQVRTSLAESDPRESLVLDICAEGPSLWRLGVIDTVLAHCEQRERDPKTVYISRWSNPVESTPFQRAGRADISHFYWGSDRYWPPGCVRCDRGHLWGFFMGRPTLPRLMLLQYLRNAGDALLSRMQGGKIPDADQGIDVDSQEFGRCPDLASWYDACGIASLDGAGIRDQYRTDRNTNLSLMAWYDQFHIEIVAESYIYGETFFPTEKTVRPISAGKPMVVMGPRHFLRRLREQGFRTWSDIWDESYDDLEGPARMTQIQTVIQDVQQQRDKIIAVCGQHAEHNRAVLANLIKKHRPGP